MDSRFSDAVESLQYLHKLSGEYNLSLAELSLLWVISLPDVDKIVVGVDKTEHLEKHIETLKKEVSNVCFEKALSIKYTNDKVLNPLNWLI